jgi:preprotein translocase subunit SecE
MCMNSIISYFQDSLVELRQVRWPTRQQAIRLSMIVIAFTLACTVLLGIVDFGLSELLKQILTFTA